MCENQRFEVFFDTVRVAGAMTVADFLIVRPRVHAADKVVGVCILPEVEGKIGLMRVYRHQLDEEVWQAPGGFIEPDEVAVEAALRELHEETSVMCAPAQVESLGTYLPDAGLIEGRVALFAARGCVAHPDHPAQDVEVGIGRLHFFDREALKKLVLSDGGVGGSTLAACLRLLHG
jgi:ADP-ribose pyrophosphatase